MAVFFTNFRKTAAGCFQLFLCLFQFFPGILKNFFILLKFVQLFLLFFLVFLDFFDTLTVFGFQTIEQIQAVLCLIKYGFIKSYVIHIGGQLPVKIIEKSVHFA